MKKTSASKSPLLPDAFASLEALALSRRSLKHQQSVKRLLSYAYTIHAASLADAQGRCLGAALDLAAFAHQLGFAPRLVMWRVQGDPAYRDHWAIAVQPDVVIDATRVQVDGSTDVLHTVTSYPANYAPPRWYAYADVVHGVWSTTLSGRRFSGRFMWTLRWRVFVQEWRVARSSRDWSHFVFALSMLWHFGTRYPLHHLRKSLESRLQRMQ